MAKERVGYALGYGKFTNVREMAEVMKQAEDRGFEIAVPLDDAREARVGQLARRHRTCNQESKAWHDADRAFARPGGDGAVFGDTG